MPKTPAITVIFNVAAVFALLIGALSLVAAAADSGHTADALATFEAQLGIVLTVTAFILFALAYALQKLQQIELHLRGRA